jgi:nucleotide-binding universal stress UspA family protein
VTTAVREGDPAHQIIQAAEEFDAQLVVVGASGLTGLARFLLGSVALNVARHAHRPVLVARPLAHGLQRVVLAVDGSEHAAQAVQFTASLPLPEVTEVIVTHVLRPQRPAPAPGTGDPATFYRDLAVVQGRVEREAAQLAEDAGALLEAAGRHASMAVRVGDPADELLRLATEHEADLILCGARGVSLIRGLLVGSVADRLLKSASCSVLIVHCLDEVLRGEFRPQHDRS